MREVIPLAKPGDKIKVIKFSCQGWGKTPFEVGSVWTVNESRAKPYAITFCEGADGFIWNDCYIVLG
jgi:hypothetical protein